MSKPILYSYWRSSCSWRVRAVMEHKNIPYEYRAVNLLKKENFSEEFLKLNPIGFVPLLSVETKDGKRESLYESLAIIDYLEQTHPEPSIYPRDPIQRSKVVAICEIIVGGVQPLQNLRVMYKAAEYANDDSKAKVWSNYWIEQKFGELETILRDTSGGGNYSVGGQFTLADICLVPQVYNGVTRFDVDIAKYPTIKRLYEFLQNNDSIRKANPDNQPDRPV